MRVLLVEDEVPLSQAISEILKKNGFPTDAAYDGLSGLEYAMSGVYDLVILDIMMPKMNGIQVLKSLREAKNAVPVLMLTARDEVEDKVNGLDSGADDYMTKPFSTDELLARIRALTRRRGDPVDEDLTFGDLTLRTKRYELVSGENSVKVSQKEYQILETLFYNPEQILTKERLIDKIWGGDSEAEYNNVEVYISFIRKKMQFLGTNVEIKTVRGAGYLLSQ